MVSLQKPVSMLFRVLLRTVVRLLRRGELLLRVRDLLQNLLQRSFERRFLGAQTFLLNGERIPTRL
ncbi:hypothetical protein ACFQ60_03260 [Streptomyces zhihengii]